MSPYSSCGVLQVWGRLGSPNLSQILHVHEPRSQVSMLSELNSEATVLVRHSPFQDPSGCLVFWTLRRRHASSMKTCYVFRRLPWDGIPSLCETQECLRGSEKLRQKLRRRPSGWIANGWNFKYGWTSPLRVKRCIAVSQQRGCDISVLMITKGEAWLPEQEGGAACTVHVLMTNQTNEMLDDIHFLREM